MWYSKIMGTHYTFKDDLSMALLFCHAGNGIYSFERAEGSRQPEVVQLRRRQSLRAQSHRLWTHIAEGLGNRPGGPLRKLEKYVDISD